MRNITLILLLLFTTNLWSQPSRFDCVETESDTRQLELLGRGLVFPENLPRSRRGTTTPDGMVTAYFSPQDMPIEAVSGYLKTATKSIRIATYNYDVMELGRDLIDAANRGVKIEFMVDFKLSFGNEVWQQLSSHPNIRKIRLPVFRGGNPQMHNKIIIIDNKVVLDGSANYSMFGLAGNYENIMAIRYPEVIEKFNSELNELRDTGFLTERLFLIGKDTNQAENWNPAIYQLLTTGNFPVEAIKPNMRLTKKLTEWREGLLNQINQLGKEDLLDHIADPNLRNKIEQLVEGTAKIERYADGTLTAADPKFWQRPDTQKGKFKVYFSPEDNLISRMTTAMNTALESPKDSFIYVSTNFITHKDLVGKLIELKDAGVYVRASFDRGRFEDNNFKHALKELAKLGFYGDPGMIEGRLRELGISQEHHPSDPRNLVTIFDNQLTGPYACNHNKCAVVSTPRKKILLNGSANWSNSAMRRNGENLMIIEDSALATIYTREMLSQQFVYRYGQNAYSNEFKNDLNFLADKLPDLKKSLGLSQDNKDWQPNVQSTAMISLQGAPANPATENVWIWVPEMNNHRGYAVQMYTHGYFNGKWLSSIGLQPGQQAHFKFFIAPKGHNPNLHGLGDNIKWEWGGSGNDRPIKADDIGVHFIRNSYQWGQG